MLDIMSELLRAGLGEINAVERAQPASLAFEIRPLRGEISFVIDEAVPDIDDK